jgi:glycosyltransferase involved in cell wall biosynthesis
VKNIYIDITDLVLWKGNFAGVPRVVFSITNEMIKHSKLWNINAIPVFFDGKHCVEIDFYNMLSERDIPKLDGPKYTLAIHALKIRLRHFAHQVTPPIAESTLKYVYHNLKHRLRSTLIQFSAMERKRPSFILKPIVMKKGDYILFTSCPTIYPEQDVRNAFISSLGANGVTVGQVVHDLIPALQPQFTLPEYGEMFVNCMITAMKTATDFFAVSKSTKEDLIRFAKINNTTIAKDKIHVIRLGDKIAQVSKKQKAKGNYILSVSTIEIRKNYHLIYYAYKHIVSQGGIPPQLIIVGRGGILTDETIHLLKNDLDVCSYIDIRTGLNDSALSELYENCMFTVYPSFYEGWGLPVAESLEYSKFCIASNSSSIPEIGGDLVEYFEPTNPAQLAYLIMKYANDTNLVAAKESKIVEQYTPTTWEHTAKQVVEYIKLSK